MVDSNMFDFEFSNSSSVIRLDFVKSSSERLPFPMDLAWEVQLAIALLLLVILYQGGKLRFLILKYLRAPDCNGPINIFICHVLDDCVAIRTRATCNWSYQAVFNPM